MKKDATYYDAARRKRNPGVATPDEVRAAQARNPSPHELPRAEWAAPWQRSGFVISCPFCAAHNVSPRDMSVGEIPPPPKRDGMAYGAVLWLVFGGLGLIVSGWPAGEIQATVWMVSVLPCCMFGFWLADRQHEKVVASIRRKYVCRRCGLEGDFIHFHTAFQEEEPDVVICPPTCGPYEDEEWDGVVRP